MDSRRGIDFWLNVSILLLVGTVLFYRLSWTEADPDLWGHVRFGQDVLRTGQICLVDPYSYVTAGSKWINHEWLAETVFGFVFNHFGSAGLVGLKLFIVASVLGLLYFYLARYGFKMLHAFIVLALVVVMIISGVQTIRPQLFTYLFFALTLIVLKAADEQKYRCLFCLPPIFAVWVNMHGGFLAGLTVLLVWAGLHLFTLFNNRSLTRKIILAVVSAVVLSGSAIFCNPYGAELISFLLRTATTARPDITEWIPLKVTSLAGLAYVLSMVVAIFSLFLGKLKASQATVILWCMMAVAPLLASRHLALFAIATVVLLGAHIASWWQQHDATFADEGFGKYSTGFKLSLIALFAVLTCYFLPKVLPRWSAIYVPSGYPMQIVDILKKIDARGNIANGYDVGEYLIWKLGPQVKVSLDGRRETIYSDEIYLENLAFQEGAGNWDRLLERYPTDLVLASKGQALFNLMQQKSEWILAFEDQNYGLFAQRGSHLAGQIKAYPKADVSFEQAYFP